MTYYNYISFYLCILICLFLEIESFTPIGRQSHSSVLVENKLYFFGGDNLASDVCINEVFYLDVSQPFNIQAPLWNDLTPNAGIPFKSCWGTASLSLNKQTIYLFGGLNRNIVTNEDIFLSNIYSFDLNSLKWSVPTTKGEIPKRRREMSSVIDNTGKMYIFSGAADKYIGSPTIQYFNDMVIFNTVESSWLILSPANAPTPQLGYSATLLSNGVIVYIGGYTPTEFVDISQITLYDTKSLTWSSKVAKLIDPIDGRDGHTAVLAPDGKIIVHGGVKLIGNEIAQSIPRIAVLNVETEQFEWTAPLVSSNVEVPSLSYHTADLVGNYMIVAFGIIRPKVYSSKIYLLDIRNYTWVYTFEPSTPSNSTSPNTSTTSVSSANPSTQASTTTNASESNNQLTTMKVVIGTLSGIVGTMILITIGFFGYRWHKKRQIERPNKIMRIAGNA